MSSDKIPCFTVAVYSLSLMIMFISLASILPFCWSLDISLYHRLEPQIGVPFDRIGICVCVCVCALNHPKFMTVQYCFSYCR